MIIMTEKFKILRHGLGKIPSELKCLKYPREKGKFPTVHTTSLYTNEIDTVYLWNLIVLVVIFCKIREICFI